MKQEKTSDSLVDHYQNIVLTVDQKQAIKQITKFLVSNEGVLILMGYAGSGKTTLLKGLVDYLTQSQQKYQLMAPTGRAAKILNLKAGSMASTVHSGIYDFKDMREIEFDDGDNDIKYLYEFKIRNNQGIRNTLFVIDEASMLSNLYSENEFVRFGSGYLLNDLITYCKILESDSHNKILFVGDPAQLPPIGMNTSPALDPEYIFDNYKIKPQTAELKEVKRQSVNSGILTKSETIRRGITSGYFNYFDLKTNEQDILSLDYSGFLDGYLKSDAQKIVICYKNESVFRLNKEIRSLKYGGDFPLRESDSVVISRNNAKYHILNGDFALISWVDTMLIERRVKVKDKCKKMIEVVLRWRKIEMLITTNDVFPQTVSGYMLENQLYNDEDLTVEVKIALYIDFKIRNPKLKAGTAEFIEGIQNDEFFNCIQLKFGYAVTCHKAQGGEWDEVYVFWDYGTGRDFNIENENIGFRGRDNRSFYRWAYTAVTRSTSTLICINPPYFSPFSKMQFIESLVQEEFDIQTNSRFIPLEIELDDEIRQILIKFGLESKPENLRMHFLQRWYHMKQHGIEIKGWHIGGYEITYEFKRAEQTAGLKYWINKSNHFRENFQVIPKKTNSEEFYSEVLTVLTKMSEILLTDAKISEDSRGLIMDEEIAESKPFLKLLFEKLCTDLPDCKISQIEHFDYRERYVFSFGSEYCTVDFEYDANGFFGRVLPIETQSRGVNIIDKIKFAVKSLKEI
jgi:tRNA A37 threonylcarbamoyladenosine biosynthesis protein TsaE